MSNDTGHRLRQALGDAAAQIAPDHAVPPGLESHQSPRRTVRWPIVAIAAAAAVSLVVAVPYAARVLTHKQNDVAATTQAPPDPAPLGPPLKPTVDEFWIGPNYDEVSRLVKVSGPGPDSFSHAKTLKNEADEITDVSASPDDQVYYFGWTSRDASCTARIYRITLGPDGEEVKREMLPGTEATGVVYTNLAVSPDGIRLTWTHDTAQLTKQPTPRCETTDERVAKDRGLNPNPIPNGQHGLTVLDISSGNQRTWTTQTYIGRWPTGNQIAWSMDSRYLVFPWPFGVDSDHPPRIADDINKTYRMLDTTVDEGDVFERSRAVPVQLDELAGYETLEILRPTVFYPAEVNAYVPQGGARILAVARKTAAGSDALLLDVWLGSGKITVVDDDYNPIQGRPGW